MSKFVTLFTKLRRMFACSDCECCRGKCDCGCIEGCPVHQSSEAQR